MEKITKIGVEKLALRRLKIIDAAMSCFIEHGFHQTGMREIAKQAGVSLGNLYNHFKGKDEILVAITAIEAEELTEFTEILARLVAPRRAFKKFVTAYLAYALKPENALISLEILTVAMRNPAVSEGFSENRAALIAALRDVLAKIDGAKLDDLTSTSLEAAKLVLDLIEGFAMRCVLEDEKPTSKAQQVLWRMLEAATGLPQNATS